MKNPRNKMNNKTIGRILIRRQLHLHGPKLNPPPNLIINGNFQPNRIPICSIKHLKKRILLIRHIRKFLMNNQDVSFHNVGDVIYQVAIDFDVEVFGLCLDSLPLLWGDF